MPTAVEKPRVVIDTNVFVSALSHPGGPPAEVIDLLFFGEIEVYVSPFILAEVERILSQKFGLSAQSIRRALGSLTAVTHVIHPNTKVTVIKQKDDDNRILECGVEAKAHYIVSGDKRHILPLRVFRGMRIVSPAEFLQQLGRHAN
ncbi:MAG: putative toxin-antitoxin system toxin component, PIN family [Chloroflexi bacterium]|nr:putative toxin-antitoxin system toxin component, PIN family [Chloroflexota bacterium]